MAEVVWTDEARHWLREIRDHIARDNPAAASQTIDGIFEKAGLLSTFPKLGYRFRDDENVRILIFGHFRIAYQIMSPDRIDIQGVFHAALDIDRYI